VDRTVRVVIAGHAFVQNLRRGHHELGVDAGPAPRIAAAFARCREPVQPGLANALAALEAG
jgi:hypothetical protein